MSPEQINLWLEIQHRQMLALERVADAVERLAPTNTGAPNYLQPLEEFASFDWSRIGAEVVRSDRWGAAIVSWRGLQFVRRSPSNRYGEAVWFSRCVGKDENGNNRYEKLISFKPISQTEVEPLPEKVTKHITKG